ncbi:hypothetical protein ABZS29_07895 [Kribbella sp. NPDC005582]|uniref:hypothetical protein n=1 Tax=Kribbella sp. NPDC005582 TaxID=3156893 RepID=UPI0033B5354A
MRANRVVLVGGLVLAAVLGVAGGYYAGVLTKPPYPVASGVPAPLGGVSGPTSEPPLPLKTPEPNGLKALNDVDFSWQTLTFNLDDAPQIRLKIRVPIGWTKKVLTEGDIRFQDSRNARWIRIKPLYPILQSPRQRRDQQVPTLQKSVPQENDLKLLGQSDDTITGTDGEPRQVSTLTYSYIPDTWLRPVLLEYVKTPGHDGANVEISVTVLPQDKVAMKRIAREAAESVTPQD